MENMVKRDQFSRQASEAANNQVPNAFMRNSKLSLLHNSFFFPFHPLTPLRFRFNKSQTLVSVLVSEIDTSLPNPLGQGLFTLSDPNSGIVVLLVGLVGSVGVTDLSHEVVLLGEDKVSDTGEVSELGVGVDIHLDNTVDDGCSDLLLGRTGSTVED